MSAERLNPITPAGYAALRAEYDQLLGTERPQLVEVVAWAAGNGDRSENGDYIYGRKRLREIDRRLSFLSRAMKQAKVVDPTLQERRDTVHFGATVELADEDDARLARVALLPLADVVAIGDHVHGLEGEAAVVALVVQDALGAQQILSLGLEQLADPGVELLGVDRLVELEGDGLHGAVMRVIVVARQELGLARQDAVEAEGVAADHGIQRHVGLGGAADLDGGVDGADAALDVLVDTRRRLYGILADGREGER